MPSGPAAELLECRMAPRIFLPPQYFPEDGGSYRYPAATPRGCLYRPHWIFLGDSFPVVAELVVNPRLIRDKLSVDLQRVYAVCFSRHHFFIFSPAIASR